LTESWREVDYRGREVIFTPKSREHILRRHDDIAARLDEIRGAIARPDLVTRDIKYRHRENHYRRTPSGLGWFKVVVQYRPVPPQGTWIGEVITAYRVDQRDLNEEPLAP
jgi:hypothetical protein